MRLPFCRAQNKQPEPPCQAGIYHKETERSHIVSVKWKLASKIKCGHFTRIPVPFLNLERDVLRRFLFAGYERRLNRAYRDRLASKGSTAQGVFWRSQSSQFARFDALMSLVQEFRGCRPTSIADIGCGYGALLDFINESSKFRHIEYLGVDITRAMISACRQKFPNHHDVFSAGNRPPKIVDFCLFSGTFNLTHSDDPAKWNDYVFACLDRCMRQTRYGLVLNLLCTPRAQIKKQIFYASRAAFIQRAEDHFGPTYAKSTRHVVGDVSFVVTRKS